MPPVTKTKTTNCNEAKRPSWISKTAMANKSRESAQTHVVGKACRNTDWHLF